MIRIPFRLEDLHETAHGSWKLVDVAHPAIGIRGHISYISRDCATSSKFIIDETGTCKIEGDARKVPAKVIKQALKNIAELQAA